MTIELPGADHILQQNSFVHGGVIGMIADSACGYSALTLMDEKNTVLTTEYKINLLAPARGPLLLVEGLVTKAGRTINVVEGKAFQHEPGSAERKLIATMTATIMTVTGRDDVRH